MHEDNLIEFPTQAPDRACCDLPRGHEGSCAFAPDTGPLEVEPGQTIDDAAWLEGWRACDEATVEARIEWHRRGYAQGFAAGRACGPTFLNLAVVSCFAFIIGVLVAASVTL